MQNIQVCVIARWTTQIPSMYIVHVFFVLRIQQHYKGHTHKYVQCVEFLVMLIIKKCWWLCPTVLVTTNIQLGSKCVFNTKIQHLKYLSLFFFINNFIFPFDWKSVSKFYDLFLLHFLIFYDLLTMHTQKILYTNTYTETCTASFCLECSLFQFFPSNFCCNL